MITYSQDGAQIQQIYSLGLRSLQEALTKTRSVLNPLEGVLIIHLTLFNHIQNFSPESLKELVGSALRILNFEYFKHNKYIYAKYLLIVLECLKLRFLETTQILTEANMLDKFYDILYDCEIYADSYDRKLFTISTLPST